MEFFNSAVNTLQTIVVGLGGALCVWGGINLLEGYGPVSYTHLRNHFGQLRFCSLFEWAG